MKSWKVSQGRRIMIWLIFGALLLAACTREVDSLPRVWIDYPRGSLRISPTQPLLVHSHAYAGSGLAEVVLSMDGVAYARSQPDEEGDDFSAFVQEWLPPGEGTYVLQVVAYDSEGTRSNPATVTVVVGELAAVEEPPEPPAEEPEEPEEPEVVEEPACPPQVTVTSDANCRSGPGEEYAVLTALPAGSQAQVAGRGPDGYWWVIDRPDGGGTCWIWEELVTLSSDTCQVSVVEPPPPPQDLTPPPVPEPVVPANGLTLSCRATQDLAWLPVQDDSGIAGYGLKLEKEISTGNWQLVNQWSRIQGKQYQVGVDCGLRFRWSVQAEDGEGNFSPWSGYSIFTVELD